MNNKLEKQDVNVNKKEDKSFWDKYGNYFTFGGLIIAILFALFFANRASDNESKYLDANEKYKETIQYWDSVTRVEDYFINEALRVSSTERILRQIKQTDPDFAEKFKAELPIAYQQIRLIQTRIDTVFKTEYAYFDKEQIVVPIAINKNLLHVEGRVVAYTDENRPASVELSVYKDTTKIVIIITQDEKTGELSAKLKSNDPDVIIASIDTRIPQQLISNRQYMFMAGGGLQATNSFRELSVPIYIGIQDSKNNWGSFIGLNMFGNEKYISGAQIGIYKIF